MQRMKIYLCDSKNCLVLNGVKSFALDCFKSTVIPRRQCTKKQQRRVSRNNFSTIAVSWCGRNSTASYTRSELSDIFTAFGPIKNVRFLSPRCAEVEFMWLASACLAIRAPRVRLPGKVALYRQWADTSMQRQIWCKKDSRTK